jgi:hypothetical protein
MIREFDLIDRNASNLRGAIGEIIAWDALRKMGIHAFKIGIWNFFPEGYPYFRDGKLAWLTKKQAEFVENKEENQIIEFDFVGVKCSSITRSLDNGELHINGYEGVYLVEVKAGHPRNVRRYVKNPMKAFTLENIKKAKEIGFKVILVIVELLGNWKCRISYREL